MWESVLPKIMSHPHMLACFSGSSAPALLGIQLISNDLIYHDYCICTIAADRRVEEARPPFLSCVSLERACDAYTSLP